MSDQEATNTTPHRCPHPEAVGKRWGAEQAVWRDYLTACQAARARHDPLPPHPTHAPAAWQEWKAAHEWLRLAGRE